MVTKNLYKLTKNENHRSIAQLLLNASEHPILLWSILFIGMPIGTLLAVALTTTSIMLHISYLLG